MTIALPGDHSRFSSLFWSLQQQTPCKRHSLAVSAWLLLWCGIPLLSRVLLCACLGSLDERTVYGHGEKKDGTRLRITGPKALLTTKQGKKGEEREGDGGDLASMIPMSL